jgi:myosin-3
MFFRKPLGLFAIVDEESRFPRGTLLFLRALSSLLFPCFIFVLSICPPNITRAHRSHPATDESLVGKLNSNIGSDTAFKRLHGGGGFGIVHYAGVVVYDSAGFLEKNRDALPDQVIDVMASCKLGLVRSLFTNPDGTRRLRASLSRRTSFNLIRLFSQAK